MTRINRRQFIQRGIGLAAGAGAGAFGLSAPYVARAAGPIILKMAHPDTALHPAQQIAMQFGKMVSERTGGEIQINVFAGGQLGSETNIVSGLTTGIVDLTMHTAGFLESFFPHIQVLDLPFLFKDVATAERLLDSSIGQQLLEEMPTKGIYGLTWGHYGWRVTETRNTPVKEPSDLKGLKIRIQPGAVFAASFKAVGAIPVVLDISELYIALSQNTVQGLELPFMAMISSKMYEVTKFVGLTNHVYNAGALMASKTRLDSLTPKQQEVIRSTAKEIQPIWRKLVAEKSVENQKACVDKGMTVNETDYPAFHKAMQPVYDEFRDKIGADLVDKVLKATTA